MKSFVDFLDVIIKTGTYNKDCKMKGIFSVICKKKKKKEFWSLYYQLFWFCWGEI